MTEIRSALAGVAIPGVLLRFLERASIAYAGTRDADLVPHVHWACGWSAEPEPERLSVLVSEPYVASLLQNVQACPRIAVTVEHIGPHETYQFKGDYVGCRAPGSAEQALFEGCRDRAVEAIMQIEQRYRFTREMLVRYLGEPALVAVMRVDEIFLQTPGPGAGRRIVPPES